MDSIGVTHLIELLSPPLEGAGGGFKTIENSELSHFNFSFLIFNSSFLILNSLPYPPPTPSRGGKAEARLQPWPPNSSFLTLNSQF